MTPKPLMTPDRWLVCSHEVMLALEERWRPRTRSSLMALRLDTEHVQEVSPRDLPRRIDELMDQGWRRVRVVLAGDSDDELQALEELSPKAAGRVRVHEYRTEPHAVVATLCAPEDAVLSAWQARRPAEDDVFVEGEGIGDDWRTRYAQAFDDWKRDARQSAPQAFDSLYPDKPAARTLVMGGLFSARPVSAAGDSSSMQRVSADSRWKWAAARASDGGRAEPIVIDCDFDDGAGAGLTVCLGSELGREAEVEVEVPQHKAMVDAKLEVWVKAPEQTEPLFVIDPLLWMPARRGVSSATGYPLTTERMRDVLASASRPALELRQLPRRAPHRASE